MKIALLCAALALALPYAAAESGEANIPTHGDLPYIADDNPAHLLDIYLPAKAEKPAPIVVFIHGGGWMVGILKQNLGFAPFDENPARIGLCRDCDQLPPLGRSRIPCADARH